MPTIWYRGDEEASDEVVSDGHPFPVKLMEDVQSRKITAKVFQAAPGTSAVLVAQANPARRAIMLTNITGAQIVYVGFGAGLTSSNGQYLHSAAGSNITLYTKDAIWALSISAAQTLSVLEEEYTAV